MQNLYIKSLLGALGCFASDFSCLPPCVEGALGRDSFSLPDPYHGAPSQQGAIQIPNSRWHPASGGTSKAFWFVAKLAVALTPSKEARSRQALGENSEQSSFKQQCY